MVMQTVRALRFMLAKPMEAAVPATVAMAAERMDTSRVVWRASSTYLSWNSSAYHWREKPPQTELLWEALKEKATSTRMGAYRKAKKTRIKKSLLKIPLRFTAAPPPPHPRRSGS